jgi:ferredoxin/flavodoxin---NADP+ reductase
MEVNPVLKNNQKPARVLSIKELTDNSYVLRISKNEMVFKPGQFIMLGMNDGISMREYSIYSGTKDNYLEVLIKEVAGGDISQQLKKLCPGDEVRLRGAYGSFTLPENYLTKKFLFVATGTGISPFHSMIRTYPDLNYKLIHGIKYIHEAYDHRQYKPNQYYPCTSQDHNGKYSGRVTGYLKSLDIDNSTLCYLCGNGNMINDTNFILHSKGIIAGNIFTEVYF